LTIGAVLTGDTTGAIAGEEFLLTKWLTKLSVNTVEGFIAINPVSGKEACYSQIFEECNR